ncbi:MULTISPECIES: homoserine dehydrogenase [Thermodesulfovibrio]|uniref:Homoserine dehydrogenase n=1 Tax=Thermodesulfovibrio yellowstonii (strain ATCC 51303 / DSM 11347 / YP87) TaxID=289376 RepID=B5YIE4_THEYD|nr:MULTISPECIES: homoserine dehydrogenase [Thermodesulfovibrio]ACI20528.1 homoserine dehydrogenase (HDH): ThrA, metL [Thermodesulfovibrio yellowstonii DSM 11347]
MKQVKVGIIGFGTVGTGTAKIILSQRELIKKRTGIELILKKVADKDIKRPREISLSEGVLIPDAWKIINDPEIDVVVELVGGIHPAKEFIIEALKKGKHVVTANKALLAEEGNEIFSIAKEKGLQVGFEASVGGGIPIIKVMREGLVANKMLAIYGIINGTTNFILTKMTNEGIDFQDALRQAQELGYAEADPTLDIEGIDSSHKITILASLAYGIPLSFKKTYCEGITKITAQDIAFAREFGYKIKLLAITKILNGEIELRVHPTMIPEDYLIAKVDGVFNAIYVEGDSVGATLYYGRGAGSMPTGSAVVADIVDIAKGTNSLPLDFSEKYSIKPIEEIESMYYFRFTALDRPGVLSKISGVFGQHNISIASVIQKGRSKAGAVPLVILTHKAKEKDVLEALEKIDKLPVVAAKSVFIRVEGQET